MMSKIQISSALDLLGSLIKTPSFSSQESDTADIIEAYLKNQAIQVERIKNNIIARNQGFDPNKKTLILNSHHDTVQIGDGWTKDPFGAEVNNGRIYGRGSNDAGGPLVSLIVAFESMYSETLPYNLVLIASAEEENFGPNGLSYVLKNTELNPDFAIVGEPTEMQVGVSEMGLLVLDAHVKGKSGHVARDTGINSIYLAMKDIEWIESHQFDKVSDYLGPTRMQVTQINSGTQHNVIPSDCSFVIDVRVNEKYRHEEIIELLESNCTATFTPRSLKWRASFTPLDHAVVQSCQHLGLKTMGSTTLSDQVHFKCPSIKMGPGKSERSHTADEYILLSEIEDGIKTYIKLLKNLTL